MSGFLRKRRQHCLPTLSLQENRQGERNGQTLKLERGRTWEYTHQEPTSNLFMWDELYDKWEQKKNRAFFFKLEGSQNEDSGRVRLSYGRLGEATHQYGTCFHLWPYFYIMYFSKSSIWKCQPTKHFRIGEDDPSWSASHGDPLVVACESNRHEFWEDLEHMDNCLSWWPTKRTRFSPLFQP